MRKSIKRISPHIKALVAAALTASIFHSSNGQALSQSAAVTERAYQDREILYELQAPESHAFRITHDYTVRKDGEQYYFNTYLARPLAKGTTNRVRLKETYVDAKSYYLDGEELVYDRTFGRLRNTVVLPAGWYLTALLAPAIIQTLPDGRVSIYTVNPRNDDVRVYLRARKRVMK